MNKTEQDLIELGKKVAHNYRLIVGVAAFFYGCFVFYQNQQSNSLEISNLKERTSKLEDRVNANEKIQHDVGQTGYDIKPDIDRFAIYQGKAYRKGA